MSLSIVPPGRDHWFEPVFALATGFSRPIPRPAFPLLLQPRQDRFAVEELAVVCGKKLLTAKHAKKPGRVCKGVISALQADTEALSRVRICHPDQRSF